MTPPSLWIRFRHTIGRAIRESGQALDRVGSRGIIHATSHRSVDDDPYPFVEPLNRHRQQMPLLRRGVPQISENIAFLAPCSTLIGSVRIGANSSVWYGATLRADSCCNGLGRSMVWQEEFEQRWLHQTDEEMEGEVKNYSPSSKGGAIVIGEGTNVQDGVVISARKGHTIIGDGVTIGHMAQIHSSRVGSYCLIGMGSIVSPKSTIEDYSFVAAGAVIPEGVTVPSGELWVGNPARKLRDLTLKEKDKLVYQADEYVKVSSSHKGVMSLGGNLLVGILDDEDDDGDILGMMIESGQQERDEDDVVDVAEEAAEAAASSDVVVEPNISVVDGEDDDPQQQQQQHRQPQSLRKKEGGVEGEDEKCDEDDQSDAVEPSSTVEEEKKHHAA